MYLPRLYTSDMSQPLNLHVGPAKTPKALLNLDPLAKLNDRDRITTCFTDITFTYARRGSVDILYDFTHNSAPYLQTEVKYPAPRLSPQSPPSAWAETISAAVADVRFVLVHNTCLFDVLHQYESSAKTTSYESHSSPILRLFRSFLEIYLRQSNMASHIRLALEYSWWNSLVWGCGECQSRRPHIPWQVLCHLGLIKKPGNKFASLGQISRWWRINLGDMGCLQQ